MIGGFYGAYITRTKVNKRINSDIESMTIEELLESIKSIPNQKGKLIESLLRIKKSSSK